MQAVSFLEMLHSLMDHSAAAVELEFCQHFRPLDGAENRQKKPVSSRSSAVYSIGGDLRNEELMQSFCCKLHTGET